MENGLLSDDTLSVTTDLITGVHVAVQARKVATRYMASQNVESGESDIEDQ